MLGSSVQLWHWTLLSARHSKSKKTRQVAAQAYVSLWTTDNAGKTRNVWTYNVARKYEGQRKKAVKNSNGKQNGKSGI